MGAVTLCSGTTGCSGVVSSANSLTGSSASDFVGGTDIKVFPNGNFIVRSSSWNGAVGAITWCSGITGCTGMVVSAENSLVGSTQGDNVGSTTIRILTDGDYVVCSSSWDGPTAANVGAVTWCNGATGCAGVISSANSLVGSTFGDSVGQGAIRELVNGNYVVASQRWGAEVGAVTWCSGSTGCSGVVSSSNSLVGSSAFDRIGSGGAIALSNGNFVVSSSDWDGTAVDVGAVTLCSGTIGCSGVVSPANSLVGSTANDQIGDVVPLTNGNYVVGSGAWDGAAENVGAVTWCSGTTGCTGAVSAANSLVGSTANDSVGNIKALTNGNYVVASPAWTGTAANVGAVTWCSGTTGCIGTVTSENSLVGSTLGDNAGNGGVTALSDGNYVVASYGWDGAGINAGAVTWCNGAAPDCAGNIISAANSLVGSSANDCVGGCAGGGVSALNNGNYVVSSPGWEGTLPNIGAVTMCAGPNGCSGLVSTSNSLAGSTANDIVGGGGVIVLANGNFVVRSPSWDGTATDVSAVTWCSGTTGCPGMVVSASNSLVGSTSGDNIGSTGIIPLANGSYLLQSNVWDNPEGPTLNAGAGTYAKQDGSTVGPITVDNSVRGTTTLINTNFGFTVSFNYVHNRMVVGRSRSNVVSIFKPLSAKTPFDYDGDGRSDISVFRPVAGAWYLQRSTAGFFGQNFGSAEDRIVPADYDGDRKTDIAVYRPSTGLWYITNSSNGAVTYHAFGIAEDLPTPADYDGDGKADISVFRPSSGTWYRINSSNGSFTAAQFGANGDRPSIGDFDGDGKADIAVFRPSTGAWYQNYSSNGFLFGEQFGISTDKITPADYDGDAKTDIAIYRPSEGLWYVKRSATTTYVPYVFGLAADIPTPGDFDGDGKADIGVFRPSDGTWYIVNSSINSYTIIQFGQNGDQPTQSAFGSY